MGSEGVDRCDQASGAAELLEARYDSQRFAYVRAREAVARLERRLSELARPDTGQALDPAFQASGGAMAWRVWAEQRREKILAELANARADEAEAKAELRRAFGRMSAMRDVARSLQSDRKAAAARKASEAMSEMILARAVSNL